MSGKKAEPKGLAPKHLVRGLALREQTGALVEQFTFTAATRKELAQWLDPGAVDRLEKEAPAARQYERERQDEPTLGESRAVLKRIADLAEGLATAISMAPTIAEGELDLVSHRLFRDLEKVRAMSSDLRTLSQGVRKRLEELPTQSRRSSHSYLAGRIAEVAESAGINVSDAPGRFVQLCETVFQALDIEADVRGSIRAHLAESQTGG